MAWAKFSQKPASVHIGIPTQFQIYRMFNNMSLFETQKDCSEGFTGSFWFSAPFSTNSNGILIILLVSQTFPVPCGRILLKISLCDLGSEPSEIDLISSLYWVVSAEALMEYLRNIKIWSSFWICCIRISHQLKKKTKTKWTNKNKPYSRWFQYRPLVKKPWIR